MGKTAFSGPVYGAKAILMSAGPATASTGGTTGVFARTIVPSGEVWYVTEIAAACSTNSSNFLVTVKAKGGSTNLEFPSGTAGTITTIGAGASTAGFNSVNVITPTGGEYEGRAVMPNSSLRVLSSGVNSATALLVTVHGFKRFLSSTRAE